MCRAATTDYMRKYKEVNPTPKDKKAEWNKTYYEKISDIQKNKRAEYRNNNRQRLNAMSVEWRQKNPERVAEYSRTAKARKRNATITRLTAQQIQDKMTMFTGCWMCGGSKEEVDHVKPLARGGYHILANLRPACKSCNGRKNAKWPFNTRTKYYA